MTDQGTDVVEAGDRHRPRRRRAGSRRPDTELLDGAFDEEHGHPGPRQYVLIAVVLCVLTAIEVGCYYLEGDLNDNLLIAMLVGAGRGEVLPRRRVVHAHEAWTRRSSAACSSIGIVGAIVVYGIVLFMFASTVLSS